MNMKKTLTIASLVLAISTVGGSAYAASDIEIGKTSKSSKSGAASASIVVPTTESSKALSAEEAAKLVDDTNFVTMAKEQGITLEELFTKLEKEGKVTRAVASTEAAKTTDTTDSTVDGEVAASTEITASTEAVSLVDLAKEQGITVDELIAKLKEESKLVKGEPLTKSIQAEKSNK